MLSLGIALSIWVCTAENIFKDFKRVLNKYYGNQRKKPEKGDEAKTRPWVWSKHMKSFDKELQEMQAKIRVIKMFMQKNKKKTKTFLLTELEKNIQKLKSSLGEDENQHT